MGEMTMDRTDRTTIRLDLRDDNGWTTFGELKRFMAECEARGATDETPAIVANAGPSLLGGYVFRPIIGVTVDHEPARADLGNLT